MPSLGVNVDHVATVRQARRGKEPDPVTAAHQAELAGAHTIIMHLREDRRHIQDRDLEVLCATLQTRLCLEMAATEEMQRIALARKPYIVCLVPEKRQELTTEGGLAVAGRVEELRDFLAPLREAGIKSSLFVEASPAQIEAAKEVGSEFVELHTGHYADAVDEARRKAELERILSGIRLARDMGLGVNLGHGLNYVNVMAFADVEGVTEYSIGHSIIARALYVGLYEAVRQMAAIVGSFRS